MKHKWFSLAAACLFVIAVGCAPQEDPGAKPADKQPTTTSGDNKMATVDFTKDVAPTLTAYCTPCHAGPDAKDGVDVTKLTAADKDKFGKLLEEIEGGKMPPAKAKQLPAEEKAKLIEHLKTLAG